MSAAASKILHLEIDGMHCAACVRRATQALTRAEAGQVSEVSIGHAQVEAPPEAAPTLLSALAKAGFTARVQP